MLTASTSAELSAPRWLSRDDLLQRFGWTPEQLNAARTVGFPSATAMRQVQRPGANGLPVSAGAEGVWSPTAVENWARTMRDMVQKTREFRG
jgi:hypothetical protein